jgi:hypothetical protein
MLILSVRDEKKVLMFLTRSWPSTESLESADSISSETEVDTESSFEPRTGKFKNKKSIKMAPILNYFSVKIGLLLVVVSSGSS